MEPLERALVKARKEQGNKSVPAIGRTLSKGSTQSSQSFTRTRVIAADEATMTREHVLTGTSGDSTSNIYRALRAQILQWLGKTGKSTLAVTSVNDQEGKTLTAVNLAVAMSMDSNQTVLLVDADLRRPSVHLKLGITPKHGLEDYLQGSADLEDCLINPGIERLVLLPARRSTSSCAELLASPQMVALTNELKHHYRDRVIIYDLPSLLANGDALGFLPNVESVLLVVRDGAVSVGEMRRAQNLLQDCSVIGTVLNAVI